MTVKPGEIYVMTEEVVGSEAELVAASFDREKLVCHETIPTRHRDALRRNGSVDTDAWTGVRIQAVKVL